MVQMTRVDLATDAGQVITEQPAILKGYVVETATATATSEVQDAATATYKLVVPISLSAGTSVTTHNVYFPGGIKVLPSASSTGVINVMWENV